MKKQAYIAIILGLTMAIQGLAQGPPKRPTIRKVPPSKGSKPAADPVSQLVAGLDKDKNGKISLKELEAIADVFKLLDKDKSGDLTATEFGLPAKPPLTPAGARPSRVSRRDESSSKASVNTRPGRPGAKKSVSTASKPKRLGGRAGLRQSGSARSVKKTGASSQTARRSELDTKGAAVNAPAKPKRVVRSAARSKTKTSTARRKPVTPRKKRNVVTKKPASGNSRAVVAKSVGSVDKELREIIEEVNSLSKEVNQAKGKIKNPNKRRSATTWLNQKYKPLLDSLTGELGGSDTEKQKAISEAKKEIENVRSLLK